MHFRLSEDEEKISPRLKNRFRFTKIPAKNIKHLDIQDIASDVDLAFDFLKLNDPDILKAIMKKFLRKAQMPFRDFDKSKEEYFDKLPKFSDERIGFEDALYDACENYIKDVDPDEYDNAIRSRRNMNNYIMGMMAGLLEENTKINLTFGQLKKLIQDFNAQ